MDVRSAYPFRFEEDDDDDSDGEGRDSYTMNVEFEPLPVYELIDPSLNNWVHHMQHILPQGRCQWVNPSMKTENEEFDEVSTVIVIYFDNLEHLLFICHLFCM